MAGGREFSGGANADASGGTIRTLQGGKPRLDGGVAGAERVVFGIADGRLVLGIVAAVMRGDFVGEPREFLRGFRLAQAFNRPR